ncbi:hypothetical protein E3U43_013868 [Larimichthys crocea]|uniref:Uncharacterized protein n=1 Tax=Larimichthys crocea TaxID=215358 RepID=A0ACD3RAZ0_LARCR|nr:hypothetical protein E3U43_013868 [Larimichthys crocea]
MPAAPCMEFCLQECPNDGLELLLNFVYTGELKLNPDNLDKVRHAASSLGVPEALALCQQFKETCEDPAPFKLKGPRRLVTDESSTADFTTPEKSSKRPPVNPTERESGDEVVEKPDHPTGEAEVTELQINVNDNGVGQVLEEVEDDDDVGDFAGIPEDTDEEYVPIAEPSSLSPSTSTARKRQGLRVKRTKTRTARLRKTTRRTLCSVPSVTNPSRASTTSKSTTGGIQGRGRLVASNVERGTSGRRIS